MHQNKPPSLVSPDVEEDRDAVIVAFAKSNGFYESICQKAITGRKPGRGSAVCQEMESRLAKGICIYFYGFDPGENGWLLYLWVKRDNLAAIKATIAQIQLNYGLASNAIGEG